MALFSTALPEPDPQIHLHLSYPVAGAPPKLYDLAVHLDFLPLLLLNPVRLYVTFSLPAQYLPGAENCHQHFLSSITGQAHGWTSQGLNRLFLNQ